MSVPHRLTLDYTLAPGWMEPWVDALMAGRALARRCPCGHVSFPPLRTCPACDGGEGDWIALPGTARIVHRTDGADGPHALARFDGADTAAIAALHDVPPGATRATLTAPPGPLPRLILTAGATP